jgi:hypothetical protein
MKKVLFLSAILVTSVITNAQQSNTTYISLGTSISSSTRLSEKVSFGGILKKTNFGVLLESEKAIPPQQRRSWYLGAELGQSFPLSTTISAVVGLEGKVDVSRKNGYVYAGPQFGFGFAISPSLQFQLSYGATFQKKTISNWTNPTGTLTLGFSSDSRIRHEREQRFKPRHFYTGVFYSLT